MHRSLLVTTCAAALLCAPACTPAAAPPVVTVAAPSAAAPPPEAPPAAAPAQPVQATRATKSMRALCEGVPCTLNVELSGFHDVSPDALFALMRLFDAVEYESDTLERDVLYINSYYYDHGYLGVKIASPSVQKKASLPAMNVRIDIVEGPQYRVGKYSVFERTTSASTEPMGGFRPGVKEGEVFSRRAVLIDIQWLDRIYRDAGYALMEATPETDLNEAEKLVTVSVPIVRGPICTFGRVRFDGLKKIPEPDVRAKLIIADGQRFTETGMLRSKEALLASGLFWRVDVSTAQGKTKTEIDVNFEVSEK